ncbi:MAG: peptidoglycan D,D-transpeptidase FtsI family protein [Pseudomonadota bacterium]
MTQLMPETADETAGLDARHGPEGARLTDVIAAREHGLDPNAEAARRRERKRAETEAARRARARWRLRLLSFAFLLAYAAVAGRMGVIAASDREPPRGWAGRDVHALRAEITDRDGALLAANLPVWSLYAHPREMVDPPRAARELAAIFPDMDAEALQRRFTDGRRFLWLRRTLTPEERLQVHDIGEPGLRFGRRDLRVYPAGRTAAHVLGGAGWGREDVRAAEIVGAAGIEHALDARLRDPDRADEPLRLSLDLRVQRAFAEVLREGMAKYSAKGAAGVLMKARTGEIVSLVSLPDFDPNDRPVPAGRVKAADFPTFNRAAQGLYELGSTFKVFTAAMVLEHGLATPETVVDTEGPLRRFGYAIRDAHRMEPRMTLREVIVESSNVGTARLAELAGIRRQKEMLESLGLTEPLGVELTEARGRPTLPGKWTELSLVTISYGHGLSASPLHLAGAYATLVNGGLKVEPTLLAGAKEPTEEDRVVSARTSAQLREMLRGVVEEGTGRNAEVPGYWLGGKTGSAEKVVNGRYAEDKVIATFAGAFPIHDPEYVIVITLDEAVAQTEWGPRRSAGWTAAPLTREALTRIAPALGLRPGRGPELLALSAGDETVRHVASR